MSVGQVVGDFQRSVGFTKGYDCREECNHATKGRHGIHGVEVTFMLLGPAGATQFVHSTNWYPATVTNPYLGRDYRGLPADLGFHAYEPQYEGQDRIGMPCKALPGLEDPRGCYYDGSSLNADPVFERLVNEGEDGVWDALMDYYRELFDVKANA